MTDPSPPYPSPGAPPSSGFRQLIVTVIVIGGILLLGTMLFVQREIAFQTAASQWAQTKFGLSADPVTNRLAAEFADADQDLIADPPADAASVSPEVIRFCYIPSGGSESQAEVWEPFVAHLEAALGRPVEYLQVDSINSQLAALKTGYLHVTGLNTGSVPRAVNVCGFVPICTIANAEGDYGYQMQIIVPANSPAKKVSDLAGSRITFVNPSSNSGFKAPVVILKQQFGMNIDSDYEYGFSTSHDNSIRGIKNGEFKAAPVASDVLARMIAQGEIGEQDFRVIYESERFPPAAIGMVHNLEPQLAQQVRDALLGFDLGSSELREAISSESSAMFAEVNYKNDWSLIRYIDDAQGTRHTVAVAAFAPPTTDATGPETATGQPPADNPASDGGSGEDAPDGGDPDEGELGEGDSTEQEGQLETKS